MVIKKLMSIMILMSLFVAVFARELKYFQSVGWYPLTMKDPQSGKYYGLSIDLMNQIVKELGTKAEFFDIPWKRGFCQLDSGDMDICAGAYENQERKDKYLLSIPFLVNETRLFVRKDSPIYFNELDNLRGKHIGKSLGSSFGNEFDQFAQKYINLTENANGKEALFEMLLLKRLDGVLMDYYDGMNYLKKNKLDKEIIPLEKPVNTVNVHLLISKKSTFAGEINDINRIINKLKKKGFFKEILSKYK